MFWPEYNLGPSLLLVLDQPPPSNVLSQLNISLHLMSLPYQPARHCPPCRSHWKTPSSPLPGQCSLRRQGTSQLHPRFPWDAWRAPFWWVCSTCRGCPHMPCWCTRRWVRWEREGGSPPDPPGDLLVANSLWSSYPNRKRRGTVRR